MAEFADYPIDTDPDDLLQEAIDELRSYWPNWEPNESSLAYRAMAALCRIIAEGRDVAAMVPEEIFRTIGRSLFNIAAIEATEATADTTWVMVDNAGYGPIPAGTLVSVEGRLFETTDDFSVPSGSTTETPVGIVALDAGADGSGLGAPGSAVSVEEAIDFVASVTLDAATAQGVDAEDNDLYVGRLRETLQLYTDTPIRASDLAKRARLRNQAVYRATAVDLYDADTDTANVEGHASVALQDENGDPVSAPVKDEVEEDLTGPEHRLLNSTIHIIDATYAFVDINFSAIAEEGSDPAEIDPAAEAAVSAMFEPNVWGLPASGENRGWTNKKTIRGYDIAAVINNVEGIGTVTDVQIKLRAADGVTVLRAFSAADADLPGVVPLPRPGVIAGAVVAP